LASLKVGIGSPDEIVCATDGVEFVFAAGGAMTTAIKLLRRQIFHLVVDIII
jgi:hypothetical protein